MFGRMDKNYRSRIPKPEIYFAFPQIIKTLRIPYKTANNEGRLHSCYLFQTLRPPWTPPGVGMCVGYVVVVVVGACYNIGDAMVTQNRVLRIN
jgi:hypothetical protein